MLEPRWARPDILAGLFGASAARKAPEAIDRGGAISTQAANSMTARTRQTIAPSPNPMQPIKSRMPP